MSSAWSFAGTFVREGQSWESRGVRQSVQRGVWGTRVAGPGTRMDPSATESQGAERRRQSPVCPCPLAHLVTPAGAPLGVAALRAAQRIGIQPAVVPSSRFLAGLWEGKAQHSSSRPVPKPPNATILKRGGFSCSSRSQTLCREARQPFSSFSKLKPGDAG